MTGTWRISFSMRSDVNAGNSNSAYLYHNGEQVPETEHIIHSESGSLISTGGTGLLLMTAQQGETLTLRSGGMDYTFNYILTCFEYNSV